MLKGLFLLLALSISASAQTPDCGSNTFTLTASGSTPNVANLSNTRCTAWVVTYYAEGFSGVSLSLQAAPDSGGSPGSFTAVGSGSITTGTNPMTATTYSFLIASIYAPWLNVAATLTGTGSVTVKIDGWRDISSIAAGGSGGGGGSSQVQILGNASLLSGQQSVTGTAAALASNAAKEVCVTAAVANTINVYLGATGVTTSTGAEMTPGKTICLHTTNTNLWFVVASTTGASVSWILTN